jgi:hypothetical protein
VSDRHSVELLRTTTSVMATNGYVSKDLYYRIDQATHDNVTRALYMASCEGAPSDAMVNVSYGNVMVSWGVMP